MPELTVEWGEAAQMLARIVIAFALALPMGWERGRGRESVGFRTLPIVAMASCGFALMAVSMPEASADSTARVMQGVITGIGFVGGGAILKTGGTVHGLVTAATIWNAGAIGVAVAFARADIALGLSAVNFLALLVLTPLKGDPTEGD